MESSAAEGLVTNFTDFLSNLVDPSWLITDAVANAVLNSIKAEAAQDDEDSTAIVNADSVSDENE